MSCPSSTQHGCRCWEHCPGPLTAPQPTVLHVVTPGPTAPSQQDVLDIMVAEARATCTACQGDPERCRTGTGHPTFRRLPNCNAWDDNGRPIALKASAPPRQPWQPRPARAA